MEVRFRELVAPLGVQIELTPLCSNRCFHCYNYWREEDVSESSIMTQAKFLKAIDLLSRAKIFYATITGGEPLFARRLWREVLKKLASCGIESDMNSNLVDVDKEDISLMKDCGLFSVLTSFHSYRESVHDGITNNLGSFRRTLANIRKLAENGLNISANMVVTKRNFRDVYKTCQLLKGAGIKAFNATRLQSPVRDQDFSSIRLAANEVDLMMEQLFAAEKDFGVSVGSLTPYPFCFLARDSNLFRLAKRTCNAGITVASLEYTGLIRACPNSEKTYGNIFSDGLEKCWQEMRQWREGKYIPSECKSCFYLPVCRGGCRAEGMKTGQMDKKDELMSGPIEREVKGLLPGSKDLYVFNDRFVVCSKMKYRRESFGYIVAGHKISSPAFVSEIVFKTLLKFRSRGKFLAKDFVNEWKVDLCEICDILSYLEDRGVITKMKKKGGRKHEREG